MNKKIKLHYCTNEDQQKIFLILIEQTITCEELLKKISKRRNKTFISFFCKGLQINNKDKICNYFESDPDYIFYASTTNDPPNEEYIQSINAKISKYQPLISVDLIRQQQENTLPTKPVPPFPIKNYKPPLMKVNNEFEFRMKITAKNARNEAKGKFVFYFSGSTIDHLFEGINVELDLSMDPFQCRHKIEKELFNNYVDINGMRLLVYLPGGIPFLGGALGDIYLNDEMNVQKVIYGVLTRQISDAILDKQCYEICNASDKEHKLLLSPICDSSERALSDIACFLGYLNRNIENSNFLLSIFASLINFPPFIISLKRIIDNNKIVGRDVVTVCSTLFTFMRNYLPSSIFNNQLFEHVLDFCSILLNFNNVPKSLPLSIIEVDINKSETKFLSDLNLGPIVYLWKPDFNEDFTFYDLSLNYLSAIELDKKSKSVFSLKPISPLYIRDSTFSIIRGKDHEYFYLNPSLSKNSKSKNMIDIIDPFVGKAESIDIEVFAKKQINENDISSVIDPYDVKQIILINLDESSHMVDDLNEKLFAAIQYISSFVNKNYNYHIHCIQGIVSFNDHINLKSPLSPFISDLEECLKNIQLNSTSKLWDSLMFSCDEIEKFKKNGKYVNAVSRILVISNGIDDNSEAKVKDVVLKLKKNEIIVDCFIFNKEKEDCKMLSAVCHATGGLAFKPEDFKEGLLLIEQSAFLNYNERTPNNVPLLQGISSTLEPDQITEDFMNQVKDNSYFDSTIENKDIKKASSNVSLNTPRCICARYKLNSIFCSRNNKIMKELLLSEELSDPTNANYDPDMKIYFYLLFGNINQIRVFLKGPDGSPYENKWWYLDVVLPDLYPNQPPIFRFISVPYHINVSSDGKICLDVLEKGYIPSMHIFDMVRQIRELLISPCFETPIQIDSYELFLNDREEYEKLARESAQRNGKDDYHSYIESSLIIDDVPSYYISQKKYYDSNYLISQISGKKIKKENLILASSGIYYDKYELEQLVKTYKNPVCPITGKILTDKFNDDI